MNPDAIDSNVTKLVILLLGWVSGHYLPTDIGASLTASAPAIAAGVGALAAFLYGVYKAYNMKKVPVASTAVILPDGDKPAVGTSVNLAPLTGIAKVVGVFLIGILAFSAIPTAPAHAQNGWGSATKPIAAKAATAKPAAAAATAKAAPLTATQVQQNPLALLQQFSTTDLQAALADAQAQNPPDVAGAQCYTALLGLISQGAGNPLSPPVGVFSALQKARDAKALLANLVSSNGPLSGLNMACAPLVLDAQSTIIGLGVGIGLVANPAGGAVALAGLPVGVAAFLAGLPKL